MVSLGPIARSAAPKSAASKPLLRRVTLIRNSDDADLDSDLLSSPLSSNKRSKVTFNPKVEEKFMEEYNVRGRSLESVRQEVKRAIDAHGQGNSEGYDAIKEIFVPKKGVAEDDEVASDEMKVYLLALTGHASLLNKGCSGLVKAVLACEWLGREEGFVRAYVQFLGSLSSAQGAYVGLVLGMLVGYFQGGGYIFSYVEKHS